VRSQILAHLGLLAVLPFIGRFSRKRRNRRGQPPQQLQRPVHRIALAQHVVVIVAQRAALACRLVRVSAIG